MLVFREVRVHFNWPVWSLGLISATVTLVSHFGLSEFQIIFSLHISACRITKGFWPFLRRSDDFRYFLAWSTWPFERFQVLSGLVSVSFCFVGFRVLPRFSRDFYYYSASFAGLEEFSLFFRWSVLSVGGIQRHFLSNRFGFIELLALFS